MEVNQYQKRTKKKDEKDDLDASKSSSDELKLLNSFEVLAEQEDMEGIQNDTIKKEKVPPIFIYTKIDNHNSTLKELRKNLLEDFLFKCKSNKTIIYAKNLSDYKAVCEKITTAQVPFHTYTPENEKPVTTILKGLASNISEEEVKTDLLEKHLKVIEVNQFVKKVIDQDNKIIDVKLPIFCIKLEKGTSIAEIKNIKTVCWCKIKWEKSFSSKVVTQCYKCQSFGHIAKNCFKKEVCAICFSEHNTLNCTNLNKLKCANCDENHKANDPACAVYQKMSQKKTVFNREEKKKYLYLLTV